jgi:hypothetical protein
MSEAKIIAFGCAARELVMALDGYAEMRRTMHDEVLTPLAELAQAAIDANAAGDTAALEERLNALRRTIAFIVAVHQTNDPLVRETRMHIDNCVQALEPLLPRPPAEALQ